ncbi:hypothetical protein [Amycolatopsis sp. CA-128772]|uniref:hypothetical protein n=1 Tax=Amycolatopsis sp. CA-128772 TaxID=2073159 RepID=UPI000CD221C0|nr:hypothetical protein [Amycolatopsis sp. CA-128772]
MEDLSAAFTIDCSVLVKIGSDAVQVLTANSGQGSETVPLGHRQPIIPPLGAVFMVGATPAEIEAWMQRAPDDSQDRRTLHGRLLATVRDRGYSLLTAEPELLQRHQAVLTEFERSDRLPRQERDVRQATAALVDLFCPDLVVGRRYDLASIVVPVPATADLPPMALRMTGMPKSAPTEQVESWIHGLRRVAAAAAAAGTSE